MFGPALIIGAAATSAAPSNQYAWHWDTDIPVCALRQDTIETGDSVEVTRTPANRQTEVWIRTKAVPHFRGGKFAGFVELASGEKFTADVYEQIYDGKLVAYAVTQDPTFLSKFSGAQAVEISHGEGVSPEVPLRATASATDALRTCEDSKMRAWGIDLAAWRALKSKPVPIGSLRDRFSNFDYPMEAAAFSVIGDAITRLDIGPDGKVKQCKSLNASKYTGFEAASCNVLRGARFTPARDAAGNAVAAPYVVAVSFRMPS